jgi:hypothetical protein
VSSSTIRILRALAMGESLFTAAAETENTFSRTLVV